MNSKLVFALVLLLSLAIGGASARSRFAERRLLTDQHPEYTPEATEHKRNHEHEHEHHHKHDHDHEHDHTPYPTYAPTYKPTPAPTRKHHHGHDHDHEHDHDDKVCWGDWYDDKELFLVLNERTRYGPPSSEDLCEKHGGKFLKIHNNGQLEVTKLFEKCYVEKAWCDTAPGFPTGPPQCLYYKAVFGSCKANGSGCGHGYEDDYCEKKFPTLCVKYKKRY